MESEEVKEEEEKAQYSAPPFPEIITLEKHSMTNTYKVTVQSYWTTSLRKLELTALRILRKLEDNDRRG